MMQNQIILVDVEPVSKDDVEQVILPQDDLDSAGIEILYRTKEAYCFTLKLNGSKRHFVIPYGFEFDSASIPSIFWWLYSPTSQAFLTAGLIHDYLYRDLMENKDYSREFADMVFKKCLEVLFESEKNNLIKPIKTTIIENKKIFKKIILKITSQSLHTIKLTKYKIHLLLKITQKFITPKICYFSVRIFAGKYFKINNKLTII